MSAMFSRTNNLKKDQAARPIGGKNYDMVKRERQLLYCTHCKINGHNKDGCFKLIGYPD
jgi:hypothetical protein